MRGDWWRSGACTGWTRTLFAVDLARVSLWLETFASEHPFTFVDHALRCGDSLVGLSRETMFQSVICTPGKGPAMKEQARNQLFNAVREAERLRAEGIHAIGDPPDNDALDDLWDKAKEAPIGVVRTLGDAMVGTYFQGESDKEREEAGEYPGEGACLAPVFGA